MHIGTYDDEPVTVALMHEYMEQQGYMLDITNQRLHHEIFLSDVSKDGSFSNVNPSRDNWIDGFFGIGGFYLYCIANFDAARAEVVFGRGNKQENKDAFDSPHTHKAAIESALGTTLQWNRGTILNHPRFSFS